VSGVSQSSERPSSFDDHVIFPESPVKKANMTDTEQLFELRPRNGPILSPFMVNLKKLCGNRCI
jgi:hypothetical protein